MQPSEGKVFQPGEKATAQRWCLGSKNTNETREVKAEGKSESR